MSLLKICFLSFPFTNIKFVSIELIVVDFVFITK